MEGIYKSSDIADKIRIIANLKNISINSMVNYPLSKASGISGFMF